MVRKAGWVTIISTISSKFAVRVTHHSKRWSILPHRRIITLSDSNSTSIFKVWPLMTSNDLISTRVSTSERFREAFARIPEKFSPFFSKSFVSSLPDTVDLDNFVVLLTFLCVRVVCQVFIQEGKQHPWNAEAVIRSLYGCFWFFDKLHLLYFFDNWDLSGTKLPAQKTLCHLNK